MQPGPAWKPLYFMPHDTPRANVIECQQTGAQVTLMAGLITIAARKSAVAKMRKDGSTFLTLKEPYRVEGKRRWV